MRMMRMKYYIIKDKKTKNIIRIVLTRDAKTAKKLYILPEFFDSVYVVKYK